MKHRHTPLMPFALAACLAAGGCAIANKGEITLARHISIGQELIDLQHARDSGAISDDEYAGLKAKIMEMVDSVDVVAAINDCTDLDDD